MRPERLWTRHCSPSRALDSDVIVHRRDFVYNKAQQNGGDDEMGKNKKRQLLGRYIVADPEICHGEPTFRGTRIMVWQVLEMVAEGKAWETIVEEWGGSIAKEAIAEAVQLASKSFIEHAHEYTLEPMPA